VLTAVDTAFQAGWPPVQAAVNKARDEVMKQIDAGAAKLVDLLKPIVKKVLELVQSKMSKKEQKEEPAEKKGAAIGDSIGNWRFEKSTIGGSFYNDAAAEDIKNSIGNLRENLDKAMEAQLEEKFKGGAKSMLGDRIGDFEIVVALMEKMAEVCVKLLNKYSTIIPLLEAADDIFKLRGDAEAKLKANKANKDNALKALDEVSLEMWKKTPYAGLRLFKAMDRIKERVEAEMGEQPDSAKQPLLDAADSMFSAQIKALNVARSQFIGRLKQKFSEAGMLDNEETIAKTVRETFRDVVFPLINIMVAESWKAVGNAYVISAVEVGKNMFLTDIWPGLQDGLNAIQNEIPDALSSMGLQISALTLTVVNILLTKAITSAVTKMIIAFELAIFAQ